MHNNLYLVHNNRASSRLGRNTTRTCVSRDEQFIVVSSGLMRRMRAHGDRYFRVAIYKLHRNIGCPATSEKRFVVSHEIIMISECGRRVSAETTTKSRARLQLPQLKPFPPGTENRYDFGEPGISRRHEDEFRSRIRAVACSFDTHIENRMRRS